MCCVYLFLNEFSTHVTLDGGRSSVLSTHRTLNGGRSSVLSTHRTLDDGRSSVLLVKFNIEK